MRRFVQTVARLLPLALLHPLMTTKARDSRKESCHQSRMLRRRPVGDHLNRQSHGTGRMIFGSGLSRSCSYSLAFHHALAEDACCSFNSGRTITEGELGFHT